MIISIGTLKIDKIKHSFMITTLNKLGTENNLLKPTKCIHEKSTANIIFNAERLNA